MDEIEMVSPSRPPAGALITAVQAKDEALVSRLLDLRADVNEKGDYGWTPLHWAAYYDLTAIADLLLRSRADIKARDDLEETPLHGAAYSASAATVTLLLSYGADVHARSNSGNTPLHLAAASGRTANAELLIKAGAALDATNSAGQTPLYLAASRNNLDMSALLLARYPAAGSHAATAELLRTRFVPADLAAAIEKAVAAPALARRLDLLRAKEVHDRGLVGGRRTLRQRKRKVTRRRSHKGHKCRRTRN